MSFTNRVQLIWASLLQLNGLYFLQYRPFTLVSTNLFCASQVHWINIRSTQARFLFVPSPSQASTPYGQPGCYFKSPSIHVRRRQWHPTPVLSPGKSHEWRSLVGCSPWGRKESDTTETSLSLSLGIIKGACFADTGTYLPDI